MAEETPAETLGERVARLRQRAGLSRTDLGALVGLGEAAIRQIESGGSKQPTFQNGVRLAQALRVSAEELAFGEVRGNPEDPFAWLREEAMAHIDKLSRERGTHILRSGIKLRIEDGHDTAPPAKKKPRK